MPLDQQPTVDAVLAFLNAPTWADSKHVVEVHQDLLLTVAADTVFATLIDQNRDNGDPIRRIDEHRAQLARCRTEGIDAAFAGRLSPTTPPDSTVTAVLEFLNAQTWDEKSQIVEAQRDLLLTDAADAVFADLLEQ